MNFRQRKRHSLLDEASSLHRISSSSSTSTSPSQTQTQPGVVGFVGLGAMGSRIALNLSRAFLLVACDTSQAAVNAFVAAAAASASPAGNPRPRPSVASARSVSELFERAAELQGGQAGGRRRAPAAVMTSLPSPVAVRDVWLGEKGLIRQAAAAASRGEATDKKGVVVALVELSTIDPETALELSAAVERENKRLTPSFASPLRFLSAPVSGGTAAAEEGTLTVLAGGPASSLRAASRFLAPFSSRVMHAGDGPGDGDAAKLANNLALAIQMASVAEALSLASLLSPGLTPKKMIEILNQCSGRCWSSDAYPPLPELRNDYKGGFSTSLMLKDLHLAKEAAAEAGRKSSTSSSSSTDSAAPSSTPLADAVAVAYRSCPGSDDFSSVFRHFYGGGKAVK